MQLAEPRVEYALILSPALSCPLGNPTPTPSPAGWAGREGQERKPLPLQGQCQVGRPPQVVLLSKYQPGYSSLGFMTRDDVVSPLTCKLFAPQSASSLPGAAQERGMCVAGQPAGISQVGLASSENKSVTSGLCGLGQASSPLWVLISRAI